jgi:Zn-finger nucleic acid-binding protein
MELDEVEIIEMELKYCERCGGLWLRTCGSERVYCSACAEKNGERRPTHSSRKSLEGMTEAVLEHLSVLCGEGGNA